MKGLQPRKERTEKGTCQSHIPRREYYVGLSATVGR